MAGWRWSVAFVCAFAIAARGTAETVPVRHTEGVVHGFLALRTLEGETIAEGDLIQTYRGGRVTSRLVFHFKDGSVHDETVVFTERGRFRLVRDHLVQKGPSFPHPIDVAIDGASGDVRVAYREDNGDEKRLQKRLALPDDVSNGLMLTLLKNIDSRVALTKVSMVAAAPKPRLVTLAVSPEGEDAFAVGGSSRKAIRYIVKVEIGGVAGVIAPLIGKQPPDTRVWILPGEAPAFVKSEGPLFFGGPVWRIELVSPVWPRTASPSATPG